VGISVDAVYENGVLKLDHPVELPERAKVHVIIEDVAQAARTALGERLRALRSQIVASGEPLLDWEQIADEVAAGRGGYRENQ
jgi:predicted DNA-binding antitoxin AbrB/MazE fold protein